MEDVWISSFLFFSFSQYVLTKKRKKKQEKKEYLAVLFVLICDLFVATKQGIQQFLTANTSFHTPCQQSAFSLPKILDVDI